MLAPVAGRSGRGAKAGRTVIQTFAPQHPAILAAVTHDAAPKHHRIPSCLTTAKTTPRNWPRRS
jgi:hypothetical protein